MLYAWQDLKQYGIIVLTGEACKIGARLLCDLTPAGVELLQEFFGGNIKIPMGSNWNHGDSQVASIMLPRSYFEELAVFCLIEVDKMAMAVSLGNSCIYGLRKVGEIPFAEDKITRRYIPLVAPGEGLRNQHMNSGRIS